MRVHFVLRKRLKTVALLKVSWSVEFLGWVRAEGLVWSGLPVAVSRKLVLGFRV